MQLGIFARTFARPTVEEILAAAKAQGVRCVQFNFACAGLATVPEAIEPALVRRIRSASQQSALTMAAVSGTCNLIQPGPVQRARYLRNLQGLIRACPALGIPVVTLCTGTRDPKDMWRAHPDNHSAEAWRDLVRSLEQLLPVAQQRQVVLGVEPEPANVIDSAPRARKLLDEMHSPWLKIVFDAANLLALQSLSAQQRVLSEAVDLLGADVAIAHAKDLTGKPGAAAVPAGQGVVDYQLYLGLLHKAGFTGPLILHSLDEDDVPGAVAFLKDHLRRLPGGATRATHALPRPRRS